MARIMCTNHKTIKFLGFKIIDIWENYLERRIANVDDIITVDDMITTDDYFDKKEKDN